MEVFKRVSPNDNRTQIRVVASGETRIKADGREIKVKEYI